MNDHSDDRGRRWLRLRLRGRKAAESEFNEEIETHLAMRVEHLVTSGVPRAEAERLARERFGDFGGAMRHLRGSAWQRERQLGRREWLGDLRQDLALTFRQMRRAPRFYLMVLLVLALGIGANAAVFGILRATLLQPLPYHAPDELVMLWSEPRSTRTDDGGARSPRTRGILGTGQLLAWREQDGGEVAESAGMISWQGNLSPAFDLPLDERIERLRGAYVTPNFFTLLGVTPLHGRLFDANDTGADGTLLVLSHELWRRAFGGDPGVVGRSVTMAGGRPRARRSFTIVGVLRPEFRFTYPEMTEAWALMPWSEAERHPRNAITFHAVARRAPGASPAILDDRLGRFGSDGIDYPASVPVENRWVMRAEPIREWVVGEVRPMLLMLGGVAALLLLITCVTVANALLARLSERQRELTLRASLGAGRGRLARQLLTEGVALAVTGSVAGTLLTVILHPALRALLPATFPQVGTIGVDLGLLGFSAAVAAVAIILAALVPVFAGLRIGARGDALRLSAGASADRWTIRWRQGLVALQAGIATLLLVAATLLLLSFHRLGQVRLGFDPGDVVTVEMRLLDRQYDEPGALERFQEQLHARVRDIPGVTTVGMSSAVPFRGVDFFPVPRRMDGEELAPGTANGRFVDPGYFDVLQVPLLRGRILDANDRNGSPRVMVVSESYAREILREPSPVGMQLDFRGPVEIVGVVGDLRYRALDQDATPAIYLPIAQFPSELICIVARIDRRQLSIAGAFSALQRAVHDVDPWLPAMRPSTLDAIIDGTVADRRFYTVATSSFAAVALALTIAGLGVVVARVVVERRRELAIRGALGASTGHLLRQTGRGSLTAVGAGVLAGLTVAWVAGAALTPFLFEVGPRNPVVYTGAGVLVVVVTTAAATLAGLRIRKIPIVELLKAE